MPQFLSIESELTDKLTLIYKVADDKRRKTSVKIESGKKRFIGKSFFDINDLSCLLRPISNLNASKLFLSMIWN